MVMLSHLYVYPWRRYERMLISLRYLPKYSLKKTTTKNLKALETIIRMLKIQRRITPAK